ncbi:MBL fold metallo-hydrolase [Williamsia sp. CHRR-6]|uniref:MBL fold metallo-hydrolase n=1 Tax=Williamsia sp. CHRR-6 TaxID=2835871 RepID=UPI0027DB5C5E|nr:MBL fold metallo-hydrolase [Williamsia sp. CHRR-6]
MIRSALGSAAVGAVGAVTSSLAAAGLATGRAFGASAQAIEPHVAHSVHRVDGAFANREPATPVDPSRGDAGAMISQRRRGRPAGPVPVFGLQRIDEPGELAVTWLGHATALIEIDGRRVLTDPVLSRRCSPSQDIGPSRLHGAPCTVAQLPPLDVVLISHDHYDHLDMQTVVEIARGQPQVRFVVPIGVGAHLQYWGVAADRITDADWGQQVTVADLEFDCVPARHFSGRGLVRNLTQYASWGIRGATRSAFFTGDTGFTEGYAEAAARGAYELTLVPIGAYGDLWPDIHVNPEEAVALHRLLAGDSVADSLLVPIHWATFNLALHPWDEPIRRTLAAAERSGVATATPAPGTRIDVVARTGRGIEHANWWHRVGSRR